MDNQKDFYIKSKFKQDDLISKNADEVFNNFLRGEIKMEEEKVVNINNTTKEKESKKTNIRKILSIAATLVVIFLGANVYAATQGYNNIFFIINNLFNPTEITDPNEILTDRDIIISYRPIEVSKGLSIQINRLIVKDNEAVLYLDVENGESKEEIDTIAVYDITDGKKELIANHSALSKKEGRHTEEIKLTKFSNKTESIQLDLQDKEFNKVISFEINLDKKEINILSASEKEMKKISEVELKEFLSKIVRINFFKDKDALTKYHTEQEYKDEIKVLYALELLDKEKASFEEVHKVIKEFTGETFEDPISLANIVVTKYDDGYKYVTEKDMHQVKALCLEVSDIKYSNGIYTVSCIYTYPTDEDYKNNKIEELDKFTTTFEFTLNENYEYTEFCVLSVNDFVSSLYEVSKETEDDIVEIPDENEENNSENKEDNSDDKEVPENNNENNNQSNSNENSGTIPEPPANTNPSDSTVINPGNVDNYASTMVWNDFFTPGLRGKMPAGWNIKEFITSYKGQEDDGKLAKSVSGVAIGINKETNEIVRSNLIINFYMPEFIEAGNTLDYTRIVANRYNMEASEAGYTSNEGMDWKMVVEPYNNREFYCHYEPMYGSAEGVGYVVEIICDNYDNYKVINIINWIFGNLKGASF